MTSIDSSVETRVGVVEHPVGGESIQIELLYRGEVLVELLDRLARDLDGLPRHVRIIEARSRFRFRVGAVAQAPW
jgi:hypothetical protein